MKVLVVLASSNRLVCQKFLDRKDRIISASYLPRSLTGSVTFVSLVYDPTSADEKFDQFLIKEFQEADAVAVLLDSRYQHLVQEFRSALFVGVVDLSSYIENIQNALTGMLAKLLRNLGHLVVSLQDSARFQAAILPLRNFDAPVLHRLTQICRETSMESAFPNNFNYSLDQLVARRGPKRRSTFPQRYFKDDRLIFFMYGYEHHSQFETGGEHRDSCHINGLYRFGYRLEKERHFNVTSGESDDDRITKAFMNCHDQQINVVSQTHVNMFSNDFCK